MDEQRSLLRPAIDPVLEFSDSDLFWQEHWKKFAWALAAIVFLILAVGAFMLRQSQQRSAAEALYAAASSPADWRAVVEKFPGSLVAGNAQLQIAGALRAEGKLDEAAAELDAFLSAQPDHPMAGAGWLTLGELRQMQKNTAGALDAYRTASASCASSYAAPLAMLAEAKLLLVSGKQGEARALLESIGTAYPQTPAAMVAGAELAARPSPETAAGLPASRN